MGIEFIRDLKTKLEAKKAKTVIVILSKYSQKFNPSKEEELKKNGMQFPTPTPFGPGKKYDWSQLENFQKQLKELGITRNQFFDKFDYIKSFEKLATELFEIFKRSEKVDEQMD